MHQKYALVTPPVWEPIHDMAAGMDLDASLARG
jgi:hypothetical protein